MCLMPPLIYECAMAHVHIINWKENLSIIWHSRPRQTNKTQRWSSKFWIQPDFICSWISEINPSYQINMQILINEAFLELTKFYVEYWYGNSRAILGIQWNKARLLFRFALHQIFNHFSKMNCAWQESGINTINEWLYLGRKTLVRTNETKFFAS